MSTEPTSGDTDGGDTTLPASPPPAPERPLVDGTHKTSDELRAELDQVVRGGPAAGRRVRGGARRAAGRPARRLGDRGLGRDGADPGRGRDPGAASGRAGPHGRTGDGVDRDPHGAGEGFGAAQVMPTAVQQKAASSRDTAQQRPGMLAAVAAALVLVLLARRVLRGGDARRAGSAAPAPPASVRPMLAVPGAVPTSPGWAFEFKWDGVRAIIAAAAGEVRLTSRNGNDVTGGYPEIVARVRVIDDARVARRRAGGLDPAAAGLRAVAAADARRAPAGELRQRVPVSLYVFDVLVVDGRWLLGEPFDAAGSAGGLGWTGCRGRGAAVVHRSGRCGRAGGRRGHGLEGVVAKRVVALRAGTALCRVGEDAVVAARRRC